MGVHAAKLGLCDKHPAYCWDWNVDMYSYTQLVVRLRSLIPHKLSIILLRSSVDTLSVTKKVPLTFWTLLRLNFHAPSATQMKGSVSKKCSNV